MNTGTSSPPFLLSEIFTYQPSIGRLYRDGKLVKGCEKYPGGTRRVWLAGKLIPIGRICWELHYGQPPTGQVRYRDGNRSNQRIENLYDPSVPTHAGRYPGVQVLKCQRTDRHRGYQGSVYVNGKRRRTPVAETPEQARDLLVLLKLQVQWEQAQQESAQ